MKDAADRQLLLPAHVDAVAKASTPFSDRLWTLLCSVQAFAMLLLTAQQTFMPLMVRAANKETHFLSTTSVFLMEVLRITACSLILCVKLGSPIKFGSKFYTTVWGNKLETLKVCVPAIVYAIQNNLYYVALANIDATTYSVTYQLRILTTALLFVLMLNKALSYVQWSALLVSLGGVVLVQLDQTKSKPLPTGHEQNRILGFFAVISMCWTSAFAGVYFEKMLKKDDADVWMQNLRLSMLTLPFATLTMLLNDWGNIQKGGLLQGWTPLVWAITLSAAAGGLLVAAVMKYADNVRKTYCQTVAIGATATLSVMLGDVQLTANLVGGVTLVIASVFLYSFYPPPPTKKAVEIDDDEDDEVQRIHRHRNPA